MLIFRQKRVTGQRLRLRTLVLKPDFTQKNFLNNLFFKKKLMETLYIYQCILHILTSKRKLNYDSNNFHFPTLSVYPFYAPRIRKKNTNKLN